MPSLMESIISLDVGAQEPWPNDVQLYQPYPMEQILLPDNANCLATQAYLHMCGLPFKIEHRANAEFMSPSGKVPFIKCGAFVVSELEPIVQFVANKGISLTEDFDNEQKSDLRAYMSLIFSVLMNAELYICWCDKRTYNEVTKVRNGSVYPWPLNHYQNWTKRSAVIKKLKLLNWYQKTLGSVYQEVETCCQALSERLEGKEFFFGSKPTEVDALLYGHTYSIFSNPVEFPLLFVIFQRFPNLIIHCRRICYYYTVLRYIDFTKTDTDIESSRESSIQEIGNVSLLSKLWKFFGIRRNVEHEDVISEFEISQHEASFRELTEELDQPKSINYLGHKVIQQHLQQDLRQKLSDFDFESNSDLWSEKDMCLNLSDMDLNRSNASLNVPSIKRSSGFQLSKDESDKTKCSGTSTDYKVDWLHSSCSSTIEIHFSNKFDPEKQEEEVVTKFSNCSLDADLDWLHDFTKDAEMPENKSNKSSKLVLSDVEKSSNYEDVYDLINKTSDAEKPNYEVDEDLLNKSSKLDIDDDDLIREECSTTSNTNAWTTIASNTDIESNLTIDNMESTVELMNDLINSVEQSESKNVEKNVSSSEVTVETYSDNHICDDDCNNVYVVNDDSFWDDDFKEKSVTLINKEVIVEKISNDSLKKYFSCESCKQIPKPYPEKEFLKLLKRDDSNVTTINSAIIDGTNETIKPRIFRKCRRLLNRSPDSNNITMQSDSKILQMYNEHLLEYRNKSNNDLENIRTACSMLKSFNTKPELTKCICKFSSNPSIPHSCECCDSIFTFKSKSAYKFAPISTFPVEIVLDKFNKTN